MMSKWAASEEIIKGFVAVKKDLPDMFEKCQLSKQTASGLNSKEFVLYVLR